MISLTERTHAAGNRVSQLDARGILSTYSYDAEQRLTGQSVPTASQAISVSYDTAPAACAAGETFSIGRLATITDESGSSQYCYDRFGHRVRSVQTVTGGPTLTIGATYNAADRLVAMTYPSGAIVTYLRNSNGQITGVDAKPTAGAAQVSVISAASYLPFGPLTTLTFGNGRSLTKSYDQDYGIDAVVDSSSTGLSQDMTLNVVETLTNLTERTTATSTTTRQINYDGLDRLTHFKNGSGTVLQGFEYDATGNRLSRTDSGTATAYTYPSTSHWLTQVGSKNRTYDANGNTTRIGSAANGTGFVFDDRNRLHDLKLGPTVITNYRINGQGERVAKLDPANAANNVYYAYDESGHLLGEYTSAGTRLKEYVWLDDLLIAILSDHNANTYQFVETDHLGTPRAVIHPSSNAIIWRWNLSNTAFGEHAPTQDPDGNGMTYTLNLRYPGQYFDAESGLNYNYFRDYDPATGRYIESDPVGLGGGISTYAYVDSSPLHYSDPLGLTKWELEFRLAQYQPAINIRGPFGINIKIKGPKLFNFGVTGHSPCVDGRRTTVSLDAKFKGDYDASSPLPLSLAIGSATLDDGLSTINTDQFAGPTAVSSDVRWNTAATGSWTIAGKTVALTGNGISGDFQVAATLSPTKWHGWEEDCTCE